MSNSTSTPAARQPISLGRLIGTTLVVLLVAGIAYWYGVNSVQPAGETEALRIYGLDEPHKNKLSDDFEDADSNGIADAPKDVAEQQDPAELVFSYLATDQERYQEVWSEFLAKLTDRVGKPIRFESFDSVEDQLKALRDGDLHVVGLNAGSVPFAVNVCGFVPACSFGNNGEPSTYTMQFIVNPNSELEELGELKGRKLTLTNPTSNSGWKAPLVVLLEEFQMQPIRDFDVVYSNGHAESIKGIANNSYEIAAVASDELAFATERNLISEGDYKTIYTSEPFSNNIIGHSHRLNPQLAAAIREGLVSVPWEETRMVEEFSPMDASEFVAVSYPDDLKLLIKVDEVMGRSHKPDALNGSGNKDTSISPGTEDASTQDDGLE